MDKDKYVYCTKCQYGKEPLDEIEKDGETKTPKNCIGCNPYNPEDSVRPEKRPNYVPLTGQQPLL